MITYFVYDKYMGKKEIDFIDGCVFVSAYISAIMLDMILFPIELVIALFMRIFKSTSKGE